MRSATDQVARYQKIQSLGVGGMGQVYLAEDRDRKERVALKFLLSDSTRDFLRDEVRLLARLSHPHLIKIFDFHETAPAGPGFPDGPFFSMEYIAGKTLDESGQEEPAKQWIDWLAQLCDGLHYLHQRNILHRDLKPANILVDATRQLKILDFGLATGGRPKAGAVAMGTLVYLAPEAFRGGYGVASDLFSLGVSLYQCLSARLPFAKPLDPSGAAPVPAQPLSARRPDLPRFLCDLVDSLLAIDPRQRPGSAMAVLRFLNQHLDQPYALQTDAAAQFALQKVPLLGRETEMAQWRALLNSIRVSPEANFAGLEGPTGIGRTRLLEEMKWQAQLEGIPFSTVGPESAIEWLAPTPDLPERGSPLAAIQRRAAGLAGSLQIVAFSDLQFWPAGALGDLRLFLNGVRGRRGRGLLLLLENNPEISNPEWDGVKDWLRQLPNYRTIALADLSSDQSEALLVNAMPDVALGPDARAEIRDASGGRPLLLLENLRERIQRGAGATLATGEIRQRFTVAAQGRIARLSEPAKRILAIALSDRGSLGLAEAESLADLQADAFEDAILELDREGLLRARDPERPEIALAQPSLREVYLSAIPEKLVEASHRRWITELKARLGSPPPIADDTLRLAEHAEASGDIATLNEAGLNAAEFQIAQGRDAEAVRWLRKLEPHAENAERRYTLQAYQAPLLYRLGKFDEALAAYDRWFQDRPDDPSCLQKAKHRFYSGQVLFAAGRESEARARFEECLGIADPREFPAHRPYQARARAFLATIEERNGQFDAARAQLGQALYLAADQAILLGEIEQRFGEIEARTLHFPEALGHFQSALRHYQSANQPQAEALALRSLAMLHRACGRLGDAWEGIAQAVALAEASGQRLQWARDLLNRALVSLDLGEYSRALGDLDAGRSVLEALGTTEDRTLTLLYRFDFYTRVGNLEAADRMLRRLGEHRAEMEKMGLWALLLIRKGEGFYLFGRLDAARQALSAALAELEANPHAHPMDRLSVRLALCRCYAGEGYPEKAGDLWPETLAVLAGMDGPYFACWHRLLAWSAEAAAGSADPAGLRPVLAGIEALENAESRRDAFRLLAAIFARKKLPEASRRLLQRAREELRRIATSLREELKMDFEKNRDANSLDQTFSEMIESPPAPAATPPPKTPVPEAQAPSSPQISELRFRQFCEINRQIAQKSDLDDILERVIDAAIELTGAERGFVLFTSQAKRASPFDGYEIKTARGLNQRSLENEEFKFSLSAVKQAVEEGRALLTSDALSDSRLQSKKSVVLYQIKSILVVPLECEGEVAGAIYLDHRYHPGCFNDESVTLLTAFAVQAGLAIQKAKLLGDLRRSNHVLNEEVQTLNQELSQVRDQLRYGYEEIVGKSPTMMQVFQHLDHVIETAIPVWVLGESGTGKELVARALHFQSPRKDAPFVSENCSAIPETLLESELFGHKKGAFTHADRDRVGLFEQANHGTLFLDEVADMSLAMQAKLLRVLQDGEVRPVGSNKKVKVDVRLVTASNKDLEKLSAEGKFRQDLFYRINGMTIALPPLRERKEDIPLLVHSIVQKIAREFKLKPSEVSDEAFRAMMNYSWPGNIRQLESVIRNAMLFAKGRLITPDVLSITKTMKAAPEGREPAKLVEGATEKEQEKQMIMDALRRNKLKKKLAAEDLGVSLRSLYFRMEKYGIPKTKPVLARYLGLKD